MLLKKLVIVKFPFEAEKSDLSASKAMQSSKQPKMHVETLKKSLISQVCCNRLLPA